MRRPLTRLGFFSHVPLKPVNPVSTNYLPLMLIAQMKNLIEQQGRYNVHNITTTLFAMGELSQMDSSIDMQRKSVEIIPMMTQSIKTMPVNSPCHLAQAIYGLGKMNLYFSDEHATCLLTMQQAGNDLLERLQSQFDVSRLNTIDLRQIAQGLAMLSLAVPQNIQDALIAQSEPQVSRSQRLAADALKKAGYTVKVEELICGAFEVDIYLPELNLIIEIDGPHHLERQQGYRDEVRHAVLRRAGYQTVALSVVDMSRDAIKQAVLTFAKDYSSAPNCAVSPNSFRY